MIVKLYPADQMGCGHYRMYYPANVAAVTEPVDVSFAKKIPMRFNRRQEVVGVEPIEADVVVLQRPLLRFLADAIPFIKKQGISVVVDIDDDFSCTHPNHPVRAFTHPKLNANSNWQHLSRACGLADLVTVTTPALAHRYGARGNGYVLPNCVPESMCSIGRLPSGRVTVGWSGFVRMHPGDLNVTGGGVADAVERAGARFLTVGSPDGVREALRLTKEPDTTGGLRFTDYAPRLAELDVGIVPLADSMFNAAKSCLKGLEFAAIGIPFVASPRPDYMRLATEEHIGLLAADRRKNWYRQLTQLLENTAYREELGRTGKELILESHTYERQAWRWVEAWEHARGKVKCTTQ